MHDELACRAERIRGAHIHLDIASVGATENIMLTSAISEGTTVITNAAREPEILDLQIFLNGMGADIQGAQTGTVVINGVKKLHAAEHRVMPDRIVAGTYLTAAAITGGELNLTHVEPPVLYPVMAKLTEMGCVFKESERAVKINAPPRLKPLPRLITEPHPGFPTDMQAQTVAALTLAEGVSVVKECIFNERNKHVPELIRMGADITMTDSATFVIRGRPKLEGTAVHAKELRGGAALILAGLAAEGETLVKDASYVERGYEEIEKALASVGGDIEKI